MGDHEEADKKADNEAFLKDVQEHDDGTSHSDHGKPRLSTTGSRSKKGKNAKRPSRYAMLAGLKDQKVAPGFVVRRRAGKMDEDDHKPSLVHSDSKKKKKKHDEESEEEEEKEPEEPPEDYSQYKDGKYVDDSFPPTMKALGNVKVKVDGCQRLHSLQPVAL